MHERGSGEIGLRGESSDGKRGESAPEIKRVGEFVEPDFLGEKDLRLERSAFGSAGVTPAEEVVVLHDVLEVVGVEDEDGGRREMGRFTGGTGLGGLAETGGRNSGAIRGAREEWRAVGEE